MKPSEEPCQEALGLGGEGKPRTPGPEKKEPQQTSTPGFQATPRRETPLPSLVPGVKQLSDRPGDGTPADPGSPGPALGLGEPLPDRNPALRRTQPAGKSCRVSGLEGTLPGRRPPSLAPGKQRKLSPAAPSVEPCHLAKLLSSLDQKSHKHLEPRKRVLNMGCPIQKKTRTLYRADQLEELEKLFQEDHYPDGDKRREISQAVGVTPQRIMVWFQNRRAKWRKGEKLNEADNKDSPADAAPGPGGGQPSCAAAPPTTAPGDTEPRPFAQELPLDAPPELLLPAEQMLAPAPQSQGAPLLLSPPPVHRAPFPAPLGPLPPAPHIPMLLDAPGIEGGPKDSTEGSWGTSFAPQPVCSFLDALDTPDYPLGNQLGPFPLTPGSQNQLFPALPPQFPYLPPFPGTPTLMPPLLDEPLFSGSYGSGGSTGQGYFPGAPMGPLLLQPPARNPGVVHWSDPCLPELSFPGPYCPPAPGPPLAGDICFQELLPAAFVPELGTQPSPEGLAQMPEGSGPGGGPLLSRAPEDWPAPSLEGLEDDRNSRGP